MLLFVWCITRPEVSERESAVVSVEYEDKLPAPVTEESTDRDLNVVAEEIVQQYMERVSILMVSLMD